MNRRVARILLVEDEPEVLVLLKESLEGAGHQVIDARSGDAALSLWQGLGQVDLVVTDVIMPKCGGVELVRALRRSQPDLLALFISGLAGGLEHTDLQNNVCNDFLQKPFAMVQLRERVARLLELRDQGLQG